MTVRGLELSERHPLHAADRTWSETNCYVDLWVEVLHSRGLDPLWGCGFVFDADLDGRQWTFHKFEPEDLRLLYGIRVAEMNVWRPLVWQVHEELSGDRLLTVEVDSYYLPDTEGVSYQRQHVKTTIAVDALRTEEPTLGYFHGTGHYVVSGADAAALLRCGQQDREALPPYVESVTFAGRPDPAAVVSRARVHLSRRAAGNPVERLWARVSADLPWLVEACAADEQVFHDYAFGTLRQCGAGAQLAAEYLRVLDAMGARSAPGAIAAFERVAESAKALQFLLYRRVRGRAADLDGPFSRMAADWMTAMDGSLAHAD